MTVNMKEKDYIPFYHPFYGWQWLNIKPTEEQELEAKIHITEIGGVASSPSSYKQVNKHGREKSK